MRRGHAAVGFDSVRERALPRPVTSFFGEIVNSDMLWSAGSAAATAPVATIWKRIVASLPAKDRAEQHSRDLNAELL